jgi:hypothetical protein
VKIGLPEKVLKGSVVGRTVDVELKGWLSLYLDVAYGCEVCEIYTEEAVRRS